MNLDSAALRAVVKELCPQILGGVVQKISQLTRLDVVMQVRLPGVTHRLMIRLEQDNAGLGLTEAKLPPAESPTGFVMLLRKHLQGRKIDKIEQNGLEKLIRFYISDKVLVLELFNRSNNLYLLNPAGKIMGMLVRDSKTDSQQAGKVYTAPALPARPDASLVDFSELHELFAPFLGTEVRKVLHGALFGLSPHQADFICRSAGLDPHEALTEKNSFNLEVAADQWKMGFDDDAFEPVLLAGGRLSPWPLGTQGEKSFPSMLKALDLHTPPPGIEDRRAVLHRVISKAREKAQAAWSKRSEALENTKTAAAKRFAGELIFANISSIEPRQELLSVPCDSGSLPDDVKEALVPSCAHQLEKEASKRPEKARNQKRGRLAVALADSQVMIKLDPQLTASENAQAYFKEYRRLKRAVLSVQEPLQRAAEEMEYLDELLYFVESAASAQELEDIKKLWSETRHSAGNADKASRAIQTGPLGPKVFVYKDFRILVGRNPRQNDQLTLKIGAAGDVWMHAQNSPGAHVVIKSAGRKIGQDVIETAAILAARNCRVRNSSKVEVSWCDIKQVRKPKGSPPGRVILRSFRTINVQPHRHVEGLEPDDGLGEKSGG